MATVRSTYPNNPADIALQVPLGSDFAAVNAAIPELKSYLKVRYPKLRGVDIRLRNPLPLDANYWYLTYTTYLHDASLVLTFTGKAMAAAVIWEIGREAIKFLKKHVPRLRIGRPRKRSLPRNKSGQKRRRTRPAR